MTKNLILITLILVLIYLYYQNRKLKALPAVSSDSASSTIFELDENQEELIAERDAAIRKKNEAEQENLSLSNKLKNKQQEVSRKETEIERLKKEKSNSEIALNKKITELKEKYSKQGKLLDTEQLESKKLEEKVEELEKQIQQLKKMPGSWNETEWPPLNSPKKDKK